MHAVNIININIGQGTYLGFLLILSLSTQKIQ